MSTGTSDERCACGRFLALPGGMAQIEDGVYHAPAGAPACEVIALRDEVERLRAALVSVDVEGMRLASGDARSLVLIARKALSGGEP